MRKVLGIFFVICKWWPYYLLIGAGLAGMGALFHSGLFSAHDIWHQVARLYWYTKALDEGQIMPTFISSLAKGYGYPLFIFSYHLPWMIGYPLMKLGFSFENVMKILFGLSFLLSSLFMYGFSLEIFKSRLAAVTASVLYLWAPYHFLTIFVSAAMGTAYTFVFVPMLFWGIYRLVKTTDKKGVILCAMGIAGLVLSHMMTLVMVLPFLGGFFLMDIFNKKWKKTEYIKVTRGLMMGGLWGIGLSAFYLLPLLVYKNSILASQPSFGFLNHYQNYFVTLKQLIYSPWGFSPLVGKAIEGGMSFQVGLAQWLAVGILLLVTIIKRFRVNLVLVISLLLMYISTIFLMTESSKNIWRFVSGLMALDYPFRLLLMAVMIGSLIAAMAIALMPTKILRLYLTIFFITVALYTNRNHIRVNMYTYYPLEDYVGAEMTTNTYSEYLPKTSNPDIFKKDYQLIKPDDLIKAGNALVNTTRELDFKVSLSEATNSAIIGQFYWPDNYLYIDGVKSSYSVAAMGEIKAPLSKGVHDIKIVNKKSMIMRFSALISAMSLITIGIYTISRRTL